MKNVRIFIVNCFYFNDAFRKLMRVAEDVNGISLTWVHSCLSRKQGIAENWYLIQMYVCKYNFVQVYYIKICKSFLRKKYIFMGTPNCNLKENWILTSPTVLLVLPSVMALCVSIPWEDMIQDYFLKYDIQKQMCYV